MALLAVLQPRAARCHARGLGSGAFARRYSRYHWFVFFSSGYLDVSVPRVRPGLRPVAGSLPPGCPIRKSAHQRVFAPTRGLSQLVTSFVASESQGILHVPFSPFFMTFLLGYNRCHIPDFSSALACASTASSLSDSFFYDCYSLCLICFT